MKRIILKFSAFLIYTFIFFIIFTRSLLPIPVEGEDTANVIFSWLFVYIILAIICSVIAVRNLSNMKHFLYRMIYIIFIALIITASMFLYHCYTWHYSINKFLILCSSNINMSGIFHQHIKLHFIILRWLT